jgi:BolA protein
MSLAPTAALLDARLRERLQPSRLEVIDESHQHAGHAGANGSGFGTHFRVRIASPLFTNRGRIARHRLVYDALQDFIDQGLHALAIEAEETSPATSSGVSA